MYISIFVVRVLDLDSGGYFLSNLVDGFDSLFLRLVFSSIFFLRSAGSPKLFLRYFLTYGLHGMVMVNRDMGSF